MFPAQVGGRTQNDFEIYIYLIYVISRLEVKNRLKILVTISLKPILSPNNLRYRTMQKD